MAVEDKYTNADTEAGKLATAAFSEGDKMVHMVETFEVAAADDDGSVYRLFKAINPDLIPVKIEIHNDAITGGTDYDLGLYKTTTDGVTGAVIDQDVLAAALDMSSAAGRGSPKEGLGAVAIEDNQKRLYELAGDVLGEKEIGYDIAITAVTVGSAAGTISVNAWFVQG